MSTVDPTRRRSIRLPLGIVLLVLAVPAAGASGWGMDWLDSTATEDAGHLLIAVCGELAAIALLIAGTFALPARVRMNLHPAILFLGATGVLLLASAVGMVVAWRQQPLTRRDWLTGELVHRPSLLTPELTAGGGLALALLAVLAYRVRRRRLRWHEEVMAHGATAEGVITEALNLGTLKHMPRWRLVVRFEDGEGTTRWVVTRARTWSPIEKGDRRIVHFDPKHPGDKRRIVVEQDRSTAG